MGDFRLLEKSFSIYWMDLAENGKISLKGILLLGITAGNWDFSIKWLMISLPVRC